MEGVAETKDQASVPQRERSTIDFPYSDLESAVEVAKGVHNAGGTACDTDQLAAELKLEAKGGGFRLRLSGAQMFGFLNYERGRVTLTELGRRLIDQDKERAARVDAFLSVPLYSKVFEQYRGSPLPPQPALERSLVTMGVGDGVKDKARQVMLRSAKQAGFLDAYPDRLVKPKTEDGQQQTPPPGGDGKPKGGNGGGGSDDLHPLIKGLLETLPPPKSEWPISDRLDWLVLANSVFNNIYAKDTTGEKIQIGLMTKGSTTAYTNS